MNDITKQLAEALVAGRLEPQKDYASVTQAEVPPSIPASGTEEEKLQFIIERLRLAQEDARELAWEYDYENPDMEESRYLDRQNARAINRKFE